jgi:hypothetical protein
MKDRRGAVSLACTISGEMRSVFNPVQGGTKSPDNAVGEVD